MRSAAFLETWLDVLRQTASRSGRPTVFGRGENPVNFVSVQEVAARVTRAVDEPAPGGRVIEVEGPQDLSLNQLAATVAHETGYSGPPRHVSRPMLHVVASTAGLLRPELGRQARAALAMDVTPLAARHRQH